MNDKPKNWTVAEMALLQEMRAEGVGNQAIARKLGRTRQAVSGKIERMANKGVRATS